MRILPAAEYADEITEKYRRFSACKRLLFAILETSLVNSDAARMRRKGIIPMNHFWLPQQEPRFGMTEMVKLAQARGYTSFTERTATEWVSLGFLPSPHKQGLAGGSSEAWRTKRQMEYLLPLLQLHQRYQGHRRAALCNIPVYAWLVGDETISITLAQVKRAMHTWAVVERHHLRTQKAARAAVDQLLLKTASPSAKNKRNLARKLRHLLSSQERSIPDFSELRELFEDLIDPDGEGEAQGNPVIPLSARLMSNGMQAYLWGVEYLADADLLETIPDGLWEWARAFWIKSGESYQQVAPLLAQEPDGADFGPLNLDNARASACNRLLILLGGGLRSLSDEFEHHQEPDGLQDFPEHLQPMLWAEGEITGNVFSRELYSPLLSANGRQQFRGLGVHLHIIAKARAESSSGFQPIVEAAALTLL